MSSFVLSVAAEDDLIAIYTEGAARFGHDQASRYNRLLFQTFQFLCENPLAAAVRPELATEIRVHPAGSHIILYTAQAGEIFILRVRHQNEDWLDH